MSQLASKNKFNDQTKPKVKIDISLKGSYIVNSKEGPFLTKQDCGDDTKRSKQEKLDIFLRKSSELLSTLRNSADQAALLKPIRRAASKISSVDRGHHTAKNHDNPTSFSMIAQEFGTTKNIEDKKAT